MSYGASLQWAYRRTAAYVDKIFKCADPGDLPIEQPTKFDLVINLKGAKALGLTIPSSLLATADEVRAALVRCTCQLLPQADIVTAAVKPNPPLI
jgi:ABC-type uncharacterized transport system substrate-binding protein